MSSRSRCGLKTPQTPPRLRQVEPTATEPIQEPICLGFYGRSVFDYFDTDRDQGETPFIPLEVFKGLMGLEKDEYPIFKELNRNVIKPAIKEINDLTDYHVEIEQKRLGRRIGELKFRIAKVKQLPVQESAVPGYREPTVSRSGTHPKRRLIGKLR